MAQLRQGLARPPLQPRGQWVARMRTVLPWGGTNALLCRERRRRSGYGLQHRRGNVAPTQLAVRRPGRPPSKRLLRGAAPAGGALDAAVIAHFRGRLPLDARVIESGGRAGKERRQSPWRPLAGGAEELRAATAPAGAAMTSASTKVSGLGWAPPRAAGAWRPRPPSACRSPALGYGAAGGRRRGPAAPLPPPPPPVPRAGLR